MPTFAPERGWLQREPFRLDPVGKGGLSPAKTLAGLGEALEGGILPNALQNKTKTMLD